MPKYHHTAQAMTRIVWNCMKNCVKLSGNRALTCKFAIAIINYLCIWFVQHVCPSVYRTQPSKCLYNHANHDCHTLYDAIFLEVSPIASLSRGNRSGAPQFYHGAAIQLGLGLAIIVTNCWIAFLSHAFGIVEYLFRKSDWQSTISSITWGNSPSPYTG